MGSYMGFMVYEFLPAAVSREVDVLWDLGLLYGVLLYHTDMGAHG
jgi:hypothetical protein